MAHENEREHQPRGVGDVGMGADTTATVEPSYDRVTTGASRKQRRPGDAYYTPAWCVDRLLDRMAFAFSAQDSFAEPFCGNGAIINAVSRWRIARNNSAGDWWSNDIALSGRSSFELEIPGDRIVISNPPYKHAFEAVQWALSQPSVIGVFYLLRLNFIASEKRQAFFAKNTPRIFVLPNRPSFTDDGRTDGTEYAWFVWEANARLRRNLIEVLDLTPSDVRRSR